MDITFNNFSGKLPGKYFTNWERYIKHGEQETESKFIEKGFHAQMGNVYYQRQGDGNFVALFLKGFLYSRDLQHIRIY